MANKFIILGIHDEHVHTVVDNVLRVRMYVGEKEFDEDFKLPEIPRAIPRTQEVFEYLLAPIIDKRMKELEVQNV